MGKDQDEKEKYKKINIKIYIGIAALLFAVSLLPYINKFSDKLSCFTVADWGTFGDYMGGTLNPMLAFLSFIALLYTINLQSEELHNSTEELKQTKKATQDSAKALEEQCKSIKLQNFENTFFNMLDLHNKIVDKFDSTKDIKSNISLSYKDCDEPIKLEKIAKNSFSSIYNCLLIYLKDLNTFDSFYTYKNSVFVASSKISNNFKFYKDQKLVTYSIMERAHFIEEIKNLKQNTLNNQINPTNEIFCKFMNHLDKYLGHYFRNIYQILLFIEKANDEVISNKKFYSNILRAQLSQDELGLLFHNCISDLGKERMLPLIIKYEFLEHLKYDPELCKHDIKIYAEESLKIEEDNPYKAFGTTNEDFENVIKTFNLI